MKFLRDGLVFSFFLLVLTCAWGQDIHYNYDREADFSTYKTYQWIDAPTGVPDEFVEQDIKRAIEEQLERKGIARVEGNADLYVSCIAVVHEKQVVDFTSIGGPRWSGMGSVQGQASHTPVGTLVVVMYDPTRERLIWRGDASKTIRLKKDPDRNYKNLQKAMEKLFKCYPPPHK